MRKIKFRCFDKKNKTMLYNLDSIEIRKTKDNEELLDEIKVTNPSFIKFAQAKCHKERFVLMQYIGVTDKNGVQIWEGDIVRGTEDNEHQGQSNVFIDTWSIQPFHYLNCYDTNKFEVIGNIWENPELVEEKI